MLLELKKEYTERVEEQLSILDGMSDEEIIDQIESLHTELVAAPAYLSDMQGCTDLCKLEEEYLPNIRNDIYSKSDLHETWLVVTHLLRLASAY